MSVPRRLRTQCCKMGRLNQSANMSNLPPMPSSLKRVSMDYIDHFSRNSVSYNSVLALGATGVDNGDNRKNGFEKINGGKNNLSA